MLSWTWLTLPCLESANVPLIANEWLLKPVGPRGNQGAGQGLGSLEERKLRPSNQNVGVDEYDRRVLGKQLGGDVKTSQTF